MSEMLKGMKVLDMTNNYAGPLCGALFADYGAEVIHIEKPVLGDDGRRYPPLVDGESLSFALGNGGKKSVVLNTKDPESIEVLKKMIADNDILLESFRPGVMDRMGLGYDVAKSINPRIIYCSISAFGSKGPYSSRAGYDVIAQAYSGFMHLTGTPDGPPMQTGVAIGDTVGAAIAFGSIMAAVYYLSMTGKGQFVDVALARGLMWCNSPFVRINVGDDVKRLGNRGPGLAPYGSFQGNDGSIIIAAVSARQWELLCGLMGKPELTTDPRFVSNYERDQNNDSLVVIIEEWLRSFECVDEAADLLAEAGIANCKVYTHTDLIKDPHAWECGWLAEIPTASNVTSKETFATTTAPADFSETPGCLGQAPYLGEHNEEVLLRYGWDKEKIKQKEDEWNPS
jgi:formyl-CoA transferase